MLHPKCGTVQKDKKILKGLKKVIQKYRNTSK